jgi:hypothetical protein
MPPRVTFWDVLDGIATILKDGDTAGTVVMNPIFSDEVADYAGLLVQSGVTDIDGWVVIPGPETEPVPIGAAGGYEFVQVFLVYGFVSVTYQREADGLDSLEYAAEKAAEARERLMDPANKSLGITTPGATVVRTAPYTPDGYQRVEYREGLCHFLPLQMSVSVKVC